MAVISMEKDNLKKCEEPEEDDDPELVEIYLRYQRYKLSKVKKVKPEEQKVNKNVTPINKYIQKQTPTRPQKKKRLLLHLH